MTDKAEFVCECNYSDQLRMWYASNSAPRERIVRCRDCKHSFVGCLSGVTRCNRMVTPYLYGCACMQVAPDGFCAWGEERED